MRVVCSEQKTDNWMHERVLGTKGFLNLSPNPSILTIDLAKLSTVRIQSRPPGPVTIRQLISYQVQRSKTYQDAKMLLVPSLIWRHTAIRPSGFSASAHVPHLRRKELFTILSILFVVAYLTTSDVLFYDRCVVTLAVSGWLA
jgi:hypothetical protein